MIGQVLLEGLGLGVLLVLVCAVGIRKGAVGMVHLYHADVQDRCAELGLTTHETIRKNSLRFKCICMPGYIAYVLICVYAVNGAALSDAAQGRDHLPRLLAGHDGTGEGKSGLAGTAERLVPAGRCGRAPVRGRQL